MVFTNWSILMTTVTTFSLPPCRGEQLRKLAEAKGKNIPDLIVDELIHPGIAHGYLSDTIPGYELIEIQDGEKIAFSIGPNYRLDLTPEEAGSLAEMIDHMIGKKGTFLGLHFDPIITVSRTGAAITVEVAGHDPINTKAELVRRYFGPNRPERVPPLARTVMSPGIARDIVTGLRKFAAGAHGL
jgi:hypothetical protein